MRNIALKLMYNGTAYHGWQMQRTEASVQETLQRGLSMVCGERVRLTGVGRTDAGVHAAGQNAHFDTECRVPADKFAFALNTMLPPDVRVRASMPAAEDFHARFSAKGKEYRYLFYNSPHASAMYRSLTAHVMYPLDAEKMDREARLALGRHDFAPFAASGSVVKDTVREIDDVRVERRGDFVEMRVHGNGFLYLSLIHI